MWYAMQVGNGLEENICSHCERELPAHVSCHCFVPHYETQMKLQGQWRTVQRILLPGYVFFSTDDIEALAAALPDVLGLAEPVRVDRQIIRLSESEENFLRSAGGENHLMEMSVGAIEGKTLQILSGPLGDVEDGRIVKIDRHKRKAFMEMELFGRTQRFQVGLEVRTKTA